MTHAMKQIELLHPPRVERCAPNGQLPLDLVRRATPAVPCRSTPRPGRPGVPELEPTMATISEASS